MELTARQSSNKVLALLFVGLLGLLVLSMTTSLWLAIDNRALRSARPTIVTPMGYDAPFAIAEQRASPAYLQMALSLLALRLNVSPKRWMRSISSCWALSAPVLSPISRSPWPVRPNASSKTR